METYEKLVECAKDKDWDNLTNILKPKDFCPELPRSINDFTKLLKVAEVLTNEELSVNEKGKTVLLKCLANSCVNGYTQKTYLLNDEANKSNENIYKFLINEASNWIDESNYTFQMNFPYDGVVSWVTDTISKYSNEKRKLTDDEREVLRLSLQFLCNFSTFAFTASSSQTNNLMQYILDKNFIQSVIKLVGHDNASIARASCAYFHNMIKQMLKDFYGTIDLKELTVQLIKSTISDIQAALDTLIILLKQPNYLKEIYNEMTIDDKLYLLDIIHQEVRTVIYNQEDTKFSWLPIDAVEFLSDRFKKTSDLILKTVDSYIKDLEPTEVTIILDILGVLSAGTCAESKLLQEDRSLLINCIYLLKSLHMAGKETNNCFTPLQNLSQLALSEKDNCCTEISRENGHICRKKIESHPAFGFKAGLIRIIGNLSHKNEKNQNIIREEDGISLLLDCCNIDARNPLIIQWTTLAIRNVCENNSENQEFIHKSTKVGVVSSAVLKEMGLTLHDEGDGKGIGIMPLPKDK